MHHTQMLPNYVGHVIYCLVFKIFNYTTNPKYFYYSPYHHFVGTNLEAVNNLYVTPYWIVKRENVLT